MKEAFSEGMPLTFCYVVPLPNPNRPQLRASHAARAYNRIIVYTLSHTIMQSDQPGLNLQRPATQTPTNLIFQKPFELFVALPMAECITRLTQVTGEQVYLGHPSSVKIDFTYCQRGSRLGVMWAIGNIEAVDASRTRIAGKLGIPFSELLITLLIFAFVYGLMLFINFRSPGTACFVELVTTPFFIMIAIINHAWSRTRLMEKLRSIQSVEPPG